MLSRVIYRRHHRSGFTLLELLLALSLTVIVLALVNMAVDLHLRSLEARRMQMEESQLARSILRMIADDLRGSVQHYEQDMSGIETLLQQSVQSAAGQAGEALAGGGAGNTPGLGGEGGGGAPAGDVDNQNKLSDSFSSAASAGSTPSIAASMSDSSASSGLETPSQNTEDLSLATIPPVPGLFGNQSQLQVDISRLPRIEEYQRYLTAEAATSVVDIPSDVKTVTYFVQSIPTAAGLGPNQPLADLSDPDAAGVGLVRRVLDRSVTQWAVENGNYTGLENSGELVAPEVAAIEFQYFNGTEWLLEWDTELEQSLPLAVSITLAMRTPGEANLDLPAGGLTAGNVAAEALEGLRLYRMVVQLPAGGQRPSDESASMEGSSGDTSGTGPTSGGAP